MIDTQGIKNIVEESKEYFDSQLELTKINAAEQSSKGISTLLMILAIGSFVLLIFICVSLFFGFYIAELLGSYSKGFGLISLIYIVFLIILVLLRDKLFVKPIQNKIIQEIFRDEDE